MESLTRLIIHTLILSPLAVFAASPARRDDADYKTTIVSRQDGWHGDSNGNIHIRMSDNTVNFGSKRATDIVALLYHECSEISCGSQGGEATIETEIVNDNWLLAPYELTGHVDGGFATSSPGVHIEMSAIAVVALEAVEDIREWQWHDDPTCHIPEHCEILVENQDNEPNTEHWYPEEIHVRLENDDGDNRAYLDFTFSVERPSQGDFCSTLVDVGSAVSGAVGSVSGPVFSLIGLFCS